MPIILKGRRRSRTRALRTHGTSWFTNRKPAFVMALLEPPLCILFLGVFHLLVPQTNPNLFDSLLSLTIVGLAMAAASVAGLALMIRPPILAQGNRMANLGINVRTPAIGHRFRQPAVLELIAPFLRTSMWESQELAMVMHRSYDLMKKHVGYIRTLEWAERYSSRPRNFMMSEAISLILKLLPPVERHSAICAGCK